MCVHVSVCVCVCVAKPVAVELRCHATARIQFCHSPVNRKIHVIWHNTLTAVCVSLVAIMSE